MTHPADVAPTVRSVAELADTVRGCVSCPELAASRTRVVPGVLPETADVLLVGEAPGRQEDEAGVPFVGAGGRLLDSLLAEAGLPREKVAVANVVKCRPPGNRTPTRTEATRCRSWLNRQLALLDPAVVCTLGGTAASWALGRHSVRIGEMRGTVHERGGRSLVVTYHPAAALRFGPRGAPRAGLAEDLRLVAEVADGP